MKPNLTVEREQLVHTAQFSRPVLELWGEGKKIVSGLYNAFSPFGVSLADIRAEGSNPAEQVITVNISSGGVHRFRFDRLETAFLQFSQETFERIPLILDASLRWIRDYVPEAQVGSHQFVHTSHCQVAGDGSVESILQRIGPSAPKSGGTRKGSGTIFHWDVPEREWQTQLVVDRSLAVSNGLFLMFTLTIGHDKINFVELSGSAREYLFGILNEIGLMYDFFPLK